MLVSVYTYIHLYRYGLEGVMQGISAARHPQFSCFFRDRVWNSALRDYLGLGIALRLPPAG